jgi:hypothetical protein
MKHWYYTFRFFFAYAMIFGGGYFLAKPRNDADKVFGAGHLGYRSVFPMACAQI